MPIVTKFLHTRMRVDDLDRTVKFYQDVFGLEVTKRHESPRGSKLVFLAVPNSDEEIEITTFPLRLCKRRKTSCTRLLSRGHGGLGST